MTIHGTNDNQYDNTCHMMEVVVKQHDREGKANGHGTSNMTIHDTMGTKHPDTM